MKTINKVFFVLLILLAFSNPSLADLNKRYANSIQDAAVIEADEIVELKVINTPTAQVVTWTKYPDSFAPNSNANLQWGETWVTLNLDVQQHCKHFKRNKLNLRIQQLLGLPPVSNESRFFVVLEAQTKDMFRPCANPSLLSDSCHAEFPDNISESHKVWYASQSSISYNSPKGYPWTRLRYTYDWNAKSNEIGVNEFVLKKGSTVKVLSVTDTATYCQ